MVWRRVAIALSAVACAAFGAGAFADEPAKVAAAQVQPLGPPSLAEFLAPSALSLTKLSPSGKQMAYVRRVGERDQLLVLDLATMKALPIFETAEKPPKIPKGWTAKEARQAITYLDWKSDDTIVASIELPVMFELYDDNMSFRAPVHVVLKADGKSPGLFLNSHQKAKGPAQVELSWIQSVLNDDPDHVMIGIRPDLETIKLAKVNIHDGTREILETGDETVTDYGTDRKGNIVTRTIKRDDGAMVLEGRAPGEKAWSTIFTFRKKDAKELAKYQVLGLADQGVIYVSAKPEAPADGDTEAVRTYDLKTRKLGPILWSNPRYDVDDIVQDTDSGEFLGGCYWVDVYQCDFKAQKLSANLAGIGKFFEGKRNLFIVSQSRDDARWILYVSGPDEPGAYYLYDTVKHDLEPLGERWPALDGRLPSMRRFAFKTRDGADLSAYVSEPLVPAPAAAAAQGKAPLIVMPHGGPEARDTYAFDLWTEYLASRGYVVLKPNFRGSGGFGRKFAEAGYGEWGKRMHDDVMDATRALIAEGKVDPDRVCIVGASYGGYEALYAAAKEPDTFKCAVALAGVSDLNGNMRWQKSFGRDSERYLYWLKSKGDPAKDGASMDARSPFHLVSTWKTPILIIHGDKDPVVPVEESRQMKRALEGAGKPVRYVEVAGMGHGDSTDEESTKVLTEIESFVGKYLRPAAPTPPATTAR